MVCKDSGRTAQETHLYVIRNIEARPYNRCCNGKAVTITYSKCVL